MIGFGQEISPNVGKYVAGERAPTSRELKLWAKAEFAARRVNLLSYIVRLQYHSILQTHQFAIDHKTTLDAPGLPEVEKRMLLALPEIEKLKDAMCEVNQLELGVRISQSGNDLDIVQPNETSLGWVIPAVIGAVIVIGIIARWAYLEKEITEVTTEYNGILRRSDMALCTDPTSKMCQDWKTAKKTGGYFKRETLIDSVKNAISSVGGGAKKGLGMGIALAIPILLWWYMPRRRQN